MMVYVYFTRPTDWELFDRWSDLGDKRRCLLERSWAGVFGTIFSSSFPLMIFAVTLMSVWAGHRRIYMLSSGSCFYSSCTI